MINEKINTLLSEVRATWPKSTNVQIKCWLPQKEFNETIAAIEDYHLNAKGIMVVAAGSKKLIHHPENVGSFTIVTVYGKITFEVNDESVFEKDSVCITKAETDDICSDDNSTDSTLHS